MDEKPLDRKKITRILLARNTPVSLVVGAANFFGSNLVDKLLSKGIQVVGLDDLTYGKKENLKEAIGNKNFHLVLESPENLELELERLDYIFIILEEELELGRLIVLFKKYKCRLLFISSVELYDKDNIAPNLRWLKKAETDIARCAKDDNLNARILRLGPVFGPRMTFKEQDPTARLIHQSLTGDLQKEVSLEFSSRALYIEDACDLAIKCILAGATAQKIFDGVLTPPIKVSEIKQILLDPVWYESRDFKPSELPPWPTPNLEKTVKFLNWHPKHKLIEGLRQTLSYFKDNEIKVDKIEDREMEKSEQLEAIKPKVEVSKFSIPYSKIFLLLSVIFITYALIWPVINLGWGVLTFRFQLSEALGNLEKGEFEKSLSNVKQASLGVSQAKSIFDSLEPIRQAGILKSQFELENNLSNLATYSSDFAQDAVLGIQQLYKGLKAVTGELNESPKDYFDKSRTYLVSSDESLSKSYALINDQNFKSNLPKILEGSVESLKDRLSLYSNLVKKARALIVVLPEVVALDSKKDYLILLQNNSELRPTGGFIGSYAKVSFERGKLKKLEASDTYVIDGQLTIHVEPPKEIREDLGQKDFFLRDSNWEPDFPTSARQAEWFYTKETGERVEGVLALDISAMEDLLSVVGSLELPDYRDEKVSADNLFEKSISHAEKSFLTALMQGVFNKLFFLPNQNWSAIVASFGKSVGQKHISLYLDNSRLFSYMVSQNWAAVLPRAPEKNDMLSDFLAPVEANLGANKANYYLDRSYNLETVISKDGELSHRLRIAYTNRSPSDAFPGGKYKNRMRIYLPFGTKLNRLLWGEANITKDASGFVDYGRSGYSFLLELLPKEQKVLVLDYQIPSKLEFIDKKASYKLDVVKQAGTLKDPFVWKISYPINYQLVSPKVGKIEPQEQTIQTDLSRDRSFELSFQKN